MPVNVGGQTISLKYGSPGNSAEINERFLSIRSVGIYTGGLLTVSDGSHATISPLVCEINDGTHQVRIQTTINVTLAVASASPYVVLRWSYTGDTADYMELLAVASGSVVSATDVVIGKCVFTAGSLTGFDYGDSTFSRTVPSTHDLYLKVVPSVGTTLKALVMPGWIQAQQVKHFVPMQETSALVPPVTHPKIYLVIVDEAGTISIDSTGTEAATPVAPDYISRHVLAEITLSPGDTSITSDKIQDVRMFLTRHSPDPDEITITTDVSGQLKVVDPVYLVLQDDNEQAVNQVNWTKLVFDTQIKTSGIGQTSGVITLPAGKLYVMSYSITFMGLLIGNCNLAVESRFRVLSGDISWGFDNSSNNVSWQRILQFGTSLPTFHDSLSGTYIILPATNTQIQLEVKTIQSSVILSGRVTNCSVSIFSR